MEVTQAAREGNILEAMKIINRMGQGQNIVLHSNKKAVAGKTKNYMDLLKRFKQMEHNMKVNGQMAKLKDKACEQSKVQHWLDFSRMANFTGMELQYIQMADKEVDVGTMVAL